MLIRAIRVLVLVHKIFSQCLSALMLVNILIMEFLSLNKTLQTNKYFFGVKAMQ